MSTWMIGTRLSYRRGGYGSYLYPVLSVVTAKAGSMPGENLKNSVLTSGHLGGKEKIEHEICTDSVWQLEGS